MTAARAGDPVDPDRCRGEGRRRPVRRPLALTRRVRGRLGEPARGLPASRLPGEHPRFRPRPSAQPAGHRDGAPPRPLPCRPGKAGRGAVPARCRRLGRESRQPRLVAGTPQTPDQGGVGQRDRGESALGRARGASPGRRRESRSRGAADRGAGLDPAGPGRRRGHGLPRLWPADPRAAGGRPRLRRLPCAPAPRPGASPRRRWRRPAAGRRRSPRKITARWRDTISCGSRPWGAPLLSPPARPCPRSIPRPRPQPEGATTKSAPGAW